MVAKSDTNAANQLERGPNCDSGPGKVLSDDGPSDCEASQQERNGSHDGDRYLIAQVFPKERVGCVLSHQTIQT